SIVKKTEELKTKKSSLEDTLSGVISQTEEVKSKQQTAQARLEELKQMESGKVDNIEEIEELVILSDSLKTQEAQFKEFCKKELVKLQESIEEAKLGKPLVENNTEVAKLSEELSENVKLLRLQLAK